jgi:pimeloyl-ACP methyl ester carboxylesterase
MAEVAILGTSELDLWADQLHELVHVLGLGAVYIAGASEGTRIAIRTALRHPQVVMGLFLWQISSGPVMKQVVDRQHLQYARIARSRGMDGVLRTPWGNDRARGNPANVHRLLSLDPVRFARTKETWATELRQEDAMPGHRDSDLQRIAQPVWIVNGIDDSHPPDRAERVAALLPDASLIRPPYTTEDWHAVRHGDLVLYGSLPEVGPLLREFVATRERISHIHSPGTDQ